MPSLVPAAEQNVLCLIQCFILCKCHLRTQKKVTESENRKRCYSTYSTLKVTLNYWAKIRYSKFQTKCEVFTTQGKMNFHALAELLQQKLLFKK